MCLNASTTARTRYQESSLYNDSFAPLRSSLTALVAGRARRRLLAASLVLLLAAGPASAGSTDWVTYVEETATRIQADPSVGANDVEEKDYTVGDFDQDGDTDLVVMRKLPFSNPGGKRNVLFLNEGGVMVDRTATLAPDMLDLTDDRDSNFADLNGDGWGDLVTAGTFGEQSRVYINAGEDAGGNWLGFVYDAKENRLPSFTFPKFCSIAIGDISGDASPDLYFTDYDNSVEDHLMINDGQGFFSDQTASRMTSDMSNSVFGNDSTIVDMNGDGFNDIVKNNSSGNNPPPGFSPRVSILYNDGTGHFNFRDDIYNLAPYMNEVADFNQDGRLDVFVVDDGQDRYLINNGNNAQGRATFTTRTVTTSPGTSFFGGSVKSADLDGDGILDMVVADVDTDLAGCNRRLTLLKGSGVPPNITYGDPLVGADRPWLQTGTFDVGILDINGDTVLDLWIGTCTGTHVFMGQATALFRDGFELGNTTAWDATSP